MGWTHSLAFGVPSSDQPLYRSLRHSSSWVQASWPLGPCNGFGPNAAPGQVRIEFDLKPSCVRLRPPGSVQLWSLSLVVQTVMHSESSKEQVVMHSK